MRITSGGHADSGVRASKSHCSHSVSNILFLSAITAELCIKVIIMALFISGLIDPSESLFTYPPGESSADFSFPDHIPLFVDEVVNGASDEIREACGNNARCIYDASQTGNLNIGVDTMQTDETNQEDQMVSGQ